MKSPLKVETFKTYLRLAKELKAYEQGKIYLCTYANFYINFLNFSGKIDDFLEQYGPLMEKAMQMDVLKLSTVNKKSTFYKISKAMPSTSGRVSIQLKSK